MGTRLQKRETALNESLTAHYRLYELFGKITATRENSLTRVAEMIEKPRTGQKVICELGKRIDKATFLTPL